MAVDRQACAARVAFLTANHGDDPRVAGDLAEIRIQWLRIREMREVRPTLSNVVDYEYRKRERRAWRVIDQRSARAMRRIVRAAAAEQQAPYCAGCGTPVLTPWLDHRCSRSPLMEVRTG